MGIKRQQGIERVIYALPKAEKIVAKQHTIHLLPCGTSARRGTRRSPLRKHSDRQRAGCSARDRSLLKDKRNVALIGGTGTAGKARFFNAVDLANRFETETKLGHQGRTVDGLMRVNLAVRRARLPAVRAGRGSALFHLINRLYERASIVVTTLLSPFALSLRSTAPGFSREESLRRGGQNWTPIGGAHCLNRNVTERCSP